MPDSNQALAAFARTFLTEAEELLRQSREDLATIEIKGAEEEIVGSLLRAFHTLKGSASLFGLENIKQTAHAMEDVLTAVREKTLSLDKDFIQLLWRGCHTLGKAVDLFRSNQSMAKPGSDEIELIDAVRIRLSKAVACPPATVSAQEPAVKTPSSDSAAEPAKDALPKTTFRIDEKELDRAIALFHKLVQQKTSLQHLVDRLLQSEVEQDLSDKLQETLQQLMLLISVLSQAFFKIKLTPVGATLEKIKALAASLAGDLSRSVEVTLSGEQILIDRKKVDALHMALVHLVRNSVAHGIETPAERQSTGKPVSGRIHIEVQDDGESLCVHYADDGRGIDLKSIREQVVKKGFADPALFSFETPQPAEFLFGPGVSTAVGVTGLSGRGVGMETVLHEVKKLGGKIFVSFVPGQKTAFEIMLPHVAKSGQIKK
ncbi:MAG: Hpt domain-containing protein [Candidatus Omnitrophota bacterium]